MRKKYIGYLLIPILFAFLIALNVGSAEASESDVVVAWSNVSDGIYPGAMNLSANMSNILGELEAGIINTTFYLTGQDAVQIALGTITNTTGNQTTFSLEIDTTLFPDQVYEFDAIACNKTNTLAFGADATQLTAVIFDNADLSMSFSATAVGYHDTVKCPLKEHMFFMINGTDEMINVNPTLYFSSVGLTTGANSFTITRGASSLNYSTTTNKTIQGLPEDIYSFWAKYTDTDGTPYNTTKYNITIDCKGTVMPPPISMGAAPATNLQAMLMSIFPGQEQKEQQLGLPPGSLGLLAVFLLAIIGYYLFIKKKR